MRTIGKFAAYALGLVLVGMFGSAAGLAQQDVITTVVGGGGANNIPALNANLNGPQQLAVDAQGNYYVAGYSQNVVYKVSTTGVITLVAGTGFGGYSGDGGQAIASQLYYPTSVAVDGANPANVYISDFYNCLVRKVSQSTGIITTVAGLVNFPVGSAPYTSCGYGGDGGKANAAELYYPNAVALNPTTGDLYIADEYNGRIRKVAGGSPTGTITTIAGGGGDNTASNECGGTTPYGDGGAANKSYACYPTGVAVDASVTPANVFFTETYVGAFGCDVREVVGASGKIYQVAGSYTLGCGFTDDVTATSGQLYGPQQLAVKVSGATTTVAVADFYNSAIRQFTLTYSGGVPVPGKITTIAGVAQSAGFGGDGGLAIDANLYYPDGVAFDSAGDFYVSDNYNNRIRKVTKSTGDINTVAGWGGANYSDPLGIKGDPGGGITLYSPSDVFADPLSTKVYVGGYSTQADYLWDSSTTDVTQLAGNGIAGEAGDGTAANGAATELYYPQGVVKDKCFPIVG